MDQIISREAMRVRGWTARVAGKDRNSHGMNRGARAIEDYQAEWDRCATELEAA